MVATVFANGNNLIVADDIVRRAITCEMDAKCELPEERPFDIDIKAHAHANRGAIVAAALTILRAWHLAHAAGTNVDVFPFGSFEEWSHRIRKPLVWLGETDPVKTIEKARSNDPNRGKHLAVVVQWNKHLGDLSAFTLGQITERAMTAAYPPQPQDRESEPQTPDPDFLAALLAVAASKDGKGVSPERLGRWLRSVEGRFRDAKVLRNDGIIHGATLWRLQRCK